MVTLVLTCMREKEERQPARPPLLPPKATKGCWRAIGVMKGRIIGKLGIKRIGETARKTTGELGPKATRVEGEKEKVGATVIAGAGHPVVYRQGTVKCHGAFVMRISEDVVIATSVVSGM